MSRERNSLRESCWSTVTKRLFHQCCLHFLKTWALWLRHRRAGWAVNPRYFDHKSSQSNQWRISRPQCLLTKHPSKTILSSEQLRDLTLARDPRCLRSRKIPPRGSSNLKTSCHMKRKQVCLLIRESLAAVTFIWIQAGASIASFKSKFTLLYQSTSLT